MVVLPVVAGHRARPRMVVPRSSKAVPVVYSRVSRHRCAAYPAVVQYSMMQFYVCTRTRMTALYRNYL
jgi:hypothetical protein